jgi:sulfonate transport system substrate-binding protein
MPHLFSRRIGVLLAAVLLVLAAVTGCGGSSSSSDVAAGGSGSYVLRVGVTSVNGTPSGSIGWGDKTGILKDKLAAAGVRSITFSFFQSGKDVVAALLAGAVDVAAVGDNPSLTAKGNGADLSLLAFDSINGDAWLVGAKGGPTSIQGLVGKTVTAPQGTIRDRAARQLIETAGLKGKIEVKDVPTPESIAGLSAGKIDATIATGTSAVQLRDQGFPVIDKASAHPGLSSVGTNVAATKFVTAHPGFAAAWQDAVGSTNADIVAHLDDYNQWVATNDGVDLALVKESNVADTFNTEPFPTDGVTQFTSAYAFLVKDGAIQQPFDLAKWVGVA